LKNGARSIFNGFSKGITGLITQPVKGAEKDGLPGFLMGSIKGLSGLIIKPVSGIIDATTKTA
jgi:vacuolar protein sorting-associated protein 13A/C